MRILIVTHYFWPEEFRINDLAFDLQARGHEVAVLAPMPNYPQGRRFPGYGVIRPYREVHRGVTIYRIPLITRGQKKQGWRLALSYISSAISGAILGPLYLWRKRFDIIFVFQPSPVTTVIPAIILKCTKRAPLMLWVQDLWPESLSATEFIHSKRLLRWVAKLVSFIYRHCDRILVQSRGFTERVIARGGDPAKIDYLPYWAEELYQPIIVEEDADERKSIPDGFKVMFAGNMGSAQNFPTILGAAQELKSLEDIHWVILGDGSERPWVEEEVKKKGLSKQVHLLGRYPVETMPSWFSLADVLLVTLKHDPIFALTIPGRVQSYLACGRPIIAALGGEGARVVQEAKAGIVCPAEDAHALATAVLAMKGMARHELKEMGMRGKAYYEKHFERVMLINQLELWMQELAEKPLR